MKTKDFEKFMIWDFNRKINPKHVKELKNSIIKNGYRNEITIYVTPVQNEIAEGKHVILDGQHRFLASKELDVEFTYEIIENNSTTTQIEESIILYNIDRKNLTFEDYAHMNRDNKHYAVLIDISKKTSFSIGTLFGIYQWRRAVPKRERTEQFAKGEFTITDFYIEKILKVYSLYNVFINTTKPKFKGGTKKWIKSFSSILTNPKVNYEKLLYKIEIHAHKLQNLDVGSNTKALYKIYNLNEKDKLDLPGNLI